MPMFEYKCGACGYAFERYSVGKGAQEEGEVCPKCSKGRVKKVFSTFASNCCGSGGGASPSSAGCGGGKSPFS